MVVNLLSTYEKVPFYRGFRGNGRCCRGRRIVFLSLFSNSLFCPEMPYFARVPGYLMPCSEPNKCCKSEHILASYCCLLVVELVVKRIFLLLRIFFNFFKSNIFPNYNFDADSLLSTRASTTMVFILTP